MGYGNVALALCILTTGVLIVKRRLPLSAWPRTPLDVPLAWFVGLSVVACFLSTLPSRSIPELRGLWSFLLFPLATFHLEDEDDAGLVVDLFRVSTVYLLLRGVLEFLAGKNDLGNRLAGGMSVYMSYAGILMVFVVLLGSRALTSSRTKASRLLDALVALGAIVAISLTFTRNAYLGLGVGLLALALAARPRVVLALPVLAGILFVFAPAPVKDRALSVFGPPDETARDRVLMWEAGLSMIRDRPFFGVGPGRVKELYPVYRREGFVDPHPGHLHNNVIHLAAETGIASALAYLAFLGTFFVSVLRRTVRSRSDESRWVTHGALGAMAALFVGGLFEYSFGDVEVLRLLLIVAALPFAIARSPAPGTA